MSTDHDLSPRAIAWVVPLVVACQAAEVAIAECIRRPMGVEPDSATHALKLIRAALGESPCRACNGSGCDFCYGTGWLDPRVNREA
jgi:hypothetical protein